jgi:XTP/dITP diphosphohydrolase
MLASHQRPWTARFVCVVALASPWGEVLLERGECAGEIIPQGRGEAGFGYDPIFVVEGTDKTMAELTMEQKNLLSHRARAVTAILPLIHERLGLE